jgi:hypothetical protein
MFEFNGKVGKVLTPSGNPSFRPKLIRKMCIFCDFCQFGKMAVFFKNQFNEQIFAKTSSSLSKNLAQYFR